MRHAIIAGLAVLALAVPVQAATETTADGQKVVCKSTMKTGTRFRTKTCHTKQQWNEIEEQNKRDAKEMIERPVIETRRG